MPLIPDHEPDEIVCTLRPMNWHREYPPDTRRTSWPRGTMVLVFLVTVLVMLILMRAIDPPEDGAPYNWILHAADMMRGGA